MSYKDLQQTLEKRQSRWYYKFINTVGIWLARHKVVYYILSYTWGLLNTIIGWLVLLILLPHGRLRGRGSARYLQLNRPTTWGFSIGRLVVVGKDWNIETLKHEFGHTVHSIIFGPLVWLFVYIPSFLRFWYIRKSKKPIYYDGIWFEYTASYIGNYYL